MTCESEERSIWHFHQAAFRLMADRASPMPSFNIIVKVKKGILPQLYNSTPSPYPVPQTKRALCAATVRVVMLYPRQLSYYRNHRGRLRASIVDSTKQASPSQKTSLHPVQRRVKGLVMYCPTCLDLFSPGVGTPEIAIVECHGSPPVQKKIPFTKPKGNFPCIQLFNLSMSKG